MNHGLGYLTFAVLCLALIWALMVAAGTRRTHDNDIAWQRQCDLATMAQLAARADQLAAEGHYRPGTAAIAEYEQQLTDVE